MSNGSALKDTHMREWKWSPGEKAAAHRAFELAFDRESESLLREAKERATQVREVGELWALEGWLGERRRAIDTKYDFRYSVLPQVFAVLLYEGKLEDHELEGIAPEKLEIIRNITRFFGRGGGS